MLQVHKRLDDEQARLILKQYDDNVLVFNAASAQLGVKRRRFFQLLKLYRKNPNTFTVSYKRNAPARITAEAEASIQDELLKEQQLIADKNIPIKFYNYSAVRDTLLENHGLRVSVPTIIARAKQGGFYIPRPEKKAHDHEVTTNYVGELIQHDSSNHRWTPYASENWYALTSLDDYSRLILYGDLFPRESSWTHICGLESVFLTYGCPLKYYVDQHSIFRYVKNRDEQRHMGFTKFTDDIDPQWKQVLKECNVGVAYALSPQAKGKIERPYRWLQDRTVRRSAKGRVTEYQQVRKIFLSEVERYNTGQVHSTTGEIPIVRFQRAIKEGKTMFRPFTVPKPFESTKDIFCLRTKRIVNHYRKISLKNLWLDVPKARSGEEVELKLVPNLESNTVEVRIWHRDLLISIQTIKASDINLVHL